MTYNYKCDKCGRHIEEEMKASEYTSEVKCKCGAMAQRDFSCVKVNCNTYFDGSYNKESR